ncbi:MAG: hypothetical protein IPL92_08110 [Saprospiraceae bacterium]|nr:hypothetical protein [Candidatus Opimibacter iunctus]
MRGINWFLCGVLLVFTMVHSYAQSPHGKDFKVSCDACHTSDSWSVSTDSIFFNHDSTRFALEGQHEVIDCRQCHTTLAFTETETKCTSCHLDIHQLSVGDDCARCHNSKSWLVDNITDLHRQNSFPLQGAHAVANCSECHISDTDLRFDPLNTDCFSCHQEDFVATTEPNHEAAGFSINCIECHKVDAFEWTGTGINHDFFPLTQGHDIDECSRCHTTGTDYTQLSPECITCHEGDYMATNNPNHQSLNFSTDCASCHSTQPGWKPADYKEHDDQYFPIYSGAHNGAWDNCVDCHKDPNNYAEFTCITCHSNPGTDNEHNEVFGYSYTSTACLACHPNGRSEGAFNHDNTNFGLTGAHITVECVSCHSNGFTGTPTSCDACHITDFDQATNPYHNHLGLSTDCATCHTTAPDWNPATFANHNDFYVLNGAHATIANECASCHHGDYNNTPTTCVGCHQTDYDQTTNPSHTASAFSTDCISCHTETAWTPATLDHDGQYFPIYSGAHEGQWDQCIDCHTTPGTFEEFTCITCHANPETNEQHNGVSGYQYDNAACLACHPTGSADGAFDHNTTAFPLTGAHNTVECVMCHANGYEGTPTACEACHTMDYNLSLNPNHTALGFSTACVTCHTTEPGWSPARLDNHNDYYVLNGAHSTIATQCASCHNGDYNNTPNTCVGCHQQDYNQTTDPSHIASQFSLDCATCHSESAWVPSTFDHDNKSFPIYSGKHRGKWDQCVDCHTTPGNYSIFTCITCHANPETNQEHNGVNGYVYNSTACLACHPTGSEAMNFDHNTTAFPLTGAHVTSTCLECHAAGFEGTSTDCISCHTEDFNQSANPNHTALGLSTACTTCHTTETGWAPANFQNHNDYYVIAGAHVTIANQCASCHNGDYTNTPNTCAGCHQDNYTQTTNPNHTALQFSNECTTCHTQSAWIPASFPNHNDFYPLEGAHAVIANECAMCHTGNYNNTPNTCVGCHLDNYNQTTNPSHTASGFGTDCATCHSQNAWQPASFNHDVQFFPIYSGEHQGEWDQCIDCHTNPNDYSVFTCITCHANPETNEQHNGVNGYAYNSTLCLACHPTGSTEGMFSHNQSNFPLTGSHTSVDCLDCHAAGFEGTPTECSACHITDFNQSTNPNHVALNIPTDCASCHTTAPDWNPATFAIHNNYYQLNGAHALIADQCVTCHNGDYNNTPSTCAGCHQSDYNQTTTPSHIALNFSTNCASCHTESAWSPAAYTDHDGQYFPIYSGGHEGVWDQCTDCHTNPSNYSIYTCVTCHASSETGQQHNGVNGYFYENSACLACHPTGDSQGSFNHNESNFPLTGAHVSVSCVECHATGYQNTPTECDACHTPDYNQASNPNHVSLGLSTDCVTCHTTAPNWNPADFPNHNDYYPLLGAHAAISDQCASCHNGNYNNTPNTCVGCHLTDYNQTNDPDHQAAQFPTTCNTCHSQNAWSPSTWNHDDLYFPIYSGSHNGEWNQCSQCHTNPNNYSVFTCLTCHQQNSTNQDHQGVNGYQYNSNACLACHPDGEGD